MSTTPRTPTSKPILGVFDSGFGGLTVLRALLPLIPAAHYIYLGDTARLPYGAKSRATVARYAVDSARFLAAQGADALVIACNTATALALDDIRAAVSIPVIGVVEPGAIAAHGAVGDHGRALVLATAATVQSNAYHAACARLHVEATEFAAPLLVPLVEEGWTDHPVTREVLRIYLADALAACAADTALHPSPQAVLLGCTHYPLIAEPIRETLRALGSSAVVIDSAETTAHHTAKTLGFEEAHSGDVSRPATFRCYATDSVEKFARLGSAFLGQPIPEVTLLDLGG
ncbi:MAG TPA: glutamate racemase [Acidobacteriaceae bacterium]|jgi:glutamate racemase